MTDPKGIQEKKVLPERVTNEMIFEAPVTFLALPKRFIGRIPAGATTHLVRNIEHLITQNVGSVTVTNFLEGQEGQDLYILGDGFTTVDHNANIKRRDGSAEVLASNKFYHFIRFNNVWIELACCEGGGGGGGAVDSVFGRTGDVVAVAGDYDAFYYTEAEIDAALANFSLIGHTHSFASLTSKPTTIAGYGITDFDSLGDARWSLLGHTHSFASLTSKPTTIAGYGITDFDSLGDARWAALVHTHAFADLTSLPTTIAGYGITDFNALGDARWSLLAHTHTFASLTSKPTTIAGYGITDFDSLGDARWSLLAHTHTFASLTSKPTTIAGYGITDLNALGDARWLQLTGGTLTGHLLFSADDTYNIGAVAATRPANILYGNSLIGHKALFQAKAGTAPSVEMTHGLLTALLDWPSADSFRVGFSTAKLVFDDGDVTLAATGHVIAGADATYDLGTSVSAARFRNAFLSTALNIGNTGSGSAITAKLNGGAGAAPNLQFYTAATARGIIGAAAATGDICADAVVGDTVFRVPSGGFWWTVDGGATMTMRISNDVLFFRGQAFELGRIASAAHTYIDFHSEGTDNDYNARIIRLSGVNGAFQFEQTGTGGVIFTAGPMWINDSANAFSAKGVTIQQDGNDDEILTFKSTDVAHGVTTRTETDTFALFVKQTSTTGGLRIEGYCDSGALRALELLAVAGGQDTTKSSVASAALYLNAVKSSGTGTALLAANGNLAVIASGGGAKFIFDADGDSHQDVGTAWTNFDTHDDIALLNRLAAHVTRENDPLRNSFSKWLEGSREELAQLRLVTFNEDGHHFLNMSRLAMLHTGAIRQLGARVEHLQKTVERLQLNAQN